MSRSASFVSSLQEDIHLPIASSNNDDGAVHASSTSNHVLDVICVPWTVDMGIMSSIGLIFYVRCGDCDTTLSLFRSLVDSSILEIFCIAFLCLPFCNCSRKSGLDKVRYEDLLKRKVVALFRGRRDRSYLDILVSFPRMLKR